MIIFQVNLTIKSEFVEAFRTFITENAQQSVATEEGNIRFEVFTVKDEPHKFMLFEMYTSVEAQQAHRETAHYKKWKEATADMIAERVGASYEAVFPLSF